MISIAFFSVVQQVLILFILICVGFVSSKTKLLKGEAIPSINNLLLYIITPAVIIESFSREYNPELLISLGKAALASLVVHVINIAGAILLVRDKSKAREAVLRFGTVFSNCGFMAIPLQSALLGAEGIFYCAAFIAVFNLFCWTYGVFVMGGKEAGFSPKSFIINPGVIAVSIGLILFFLPISLPDIILSSLRNLAALNTPIPMIVIGYYLSCFTSLRTLKNAKLWLATLLRLIVLPLVAILLLCALGIKGTILSSIAISACAPVAANALVFASKYNRDTELAATFVSASTLASIVTMPIVVSLAMTLP